MFDEYDLEINKLLDNGYAEYAPVDITFGRTWFIHHYCVPEKEDQIHLVLGCASVFHNKALNTKVYQSPDCVNKSNFVLLKFQHPYAITADI